MRHLSRLRVTLAAAVIGAFVPSVSAFAEDCQPLLDDFNRAIDSGVESQAQSGSFMGSEFSYSDIATPHVDDYSYSVSSDEKCPQAEAASQMCFVVESTPVNDKIKERTGYSKSVTWLRHDNYIGVKAEYYDFDGKLFKRLEASEVKEVDTTKHKWLAHKVHMNNLKTGRYTDLHFANVKSNQPIQDSTFTQQNLESGR